MDESTVHHGETDLGGVRLRYVEAGEGPLVLLVHGYPEFWYSWRHQILPLADAGFRGVVPDTRGTNLSSRPSEVEAYREKLLGQDIVDLVEGLGESRAAVVGHDWGGWSDEWRADRTEAPGVAAGDGGHSVGVSQGAGEDWVPDVRVELSAGANHRVQQHRPERVTELLETFLTDNRPPRGVRRFP